MAEKPGDFFKEIWKELTEPPKWAKNAKKPSGGDKKEKKDDKKKDDGKKTEADASSAQVKKNEKDKENNQKRQPPPWWSWSASDGIPDKPSKRKKATSAPAHTGDANLDSERRTSTRSTRKKGRIGPPGNKKAPLPPTRDLLGDLGSQQPSPFSNVESVMRSHGYAPAALRQFGLTATKVEPFGPVLRMRTPQGLIALKKTYLPPKHVQFLYEATEHLKDKAFTHVSPYLLSSKGLPYVQIGGDTYYATQWIRGQEADFRSGRQLAAAAITLARFHQASRGFEPKGYAPASIFDMVDRFVDRRHELQLWKDRAKAKKRQDDVDAIFLKHVDAYTDQADKALAILKRPEVRAHLFYEEDDPCLCHLDLTPYNMVYTPNHQICLIDLDFSTYGPRTLDIAHLIRRALQRQNWDEDVAWHTLMNYQTLRPLVPAEHQIIYGLLIFPHRFWRIAYQHYEQGHDPHHLGFFQLAEAEEAQRQKFLTQYGKVINRKSPFENLFKKD